ncbi:Asp-tRNA(Asn)/Glu-tRNA(Gln) amidotransferase subunit GatC [Candidatus Peregrinibacteria bacterium]|nr:Asp-tRNA(Asn)/Glu-tRNA(Gln) amidotransferase subunit GatC [Candidatus Peregrinibacteria bacterium]
MIDEKQVKHIAKLARLELKDGKVSKFSGQLNDILDYMALLEKVDVKKVEETSQVTGLKNVSQEDRIITKCDGDTLLLCSPLPKERKQIRVKPAITM